VVAACRAERQTLRQAGAVDKLLRRKINTLSTTPLPARPPGRPPRCSGGRALPWLLVGGAATRQLQPLPCRAKVADNAKQARPGLFRR